MLRQVCATGALSTMGYILLKPRVSRGSPDNKSSGLELYSKKQLVTAAENRQPWLSRDARNTKGDT
jgi:hypothetical protein